MSSQNDAKIVKTVCTICPASCGIDAYVKDGRVIKVAGSKESPSNKLCVKAQGIVDWQYSAERIIHPLKRIDGGWEKISWDEAFDVIGNKLKYLKENYGAKSLVVHIGEPLIDNQAGGVAGRFCSLYGTPNFTTASSLCFVAKGIGYGLSLSRHMLFLFPSYQGTRCVVVWGSNPQQSNVGQAADILSAKRNGAKIVVVDPKKIPLAKEADIYIQIRPGTDCALALGVLNVIIAEKLYDEAFVRDWTAGFDRLTEHVKKYSPEVVEQITWVPAETIRKFARMYATSKPAVITEGVSLEHCTSGVQSSRAISILIAITGNLDIPGGNIYGSPLSQASLMVKGTASPDEAIGSQYPIFSEFTGEVTAVPLADTIITQKPYPVKALIVQAGNPVLAWPNSNKVKEALSKLELLVVSDLFMTETAKLADIFLPAATFLEREILKDYGFNGLPLVTIANKAVEPLGDCLEDWQIWSELGKKMGYADYFPWQSTDELNAYLLGPSGITLKQIRQSPSGILYRDHKRKEQYKENGFNTPSGKVELFSQIMADYGYDPLPAFTELAESPISQSDMADKYSFILISGPRVSAFANSQHRNVASLRKLVPEPLIEINTDSAGEIGIADGDMVGVESPRGSIEIKAKLTGDIHPRVVSVQHGWDEANANVLTDDKGGDPVSAYPGFRSVLCRVVKARN